MAKKKHTLHCWMRVVSPNKLKKDDGIHMKIPTKPPKKSSQGNPADIDSAYWTGYEGLWNASNGSAKVTSYVLDAGEAFYKRKHAVDWIEEEGGPGEKWKNEALCVSLVAFEITLDK